MDEDAESVVPSTPSDFYTIEAPAVDESAAGDPSRPDLSRPMEVSDVAVNGGEDGDDESSEMDVAASSRSASPLPQHDAEGEQRPMDRPSHAGCKRKLDDTSNNLRPSTPHQVVHDPHKRLRVSTSPTEGMDGALKLPPELWQQVFLRLSPAMLCRCLRVNKAFHAYLTQMKAAPLAKKDVKKVRQVRLLDSETIWAEARKLHFQNMPRPLMRYSELEMLQLISGSTCQFCHRLPAPVPATTPFNAGPGPEGVRVVWPFGIRTCGQCWEQHSIKDVQILISPAASLRYGLPYAFRTPDLHFVPEMTRQSYPGGIPSQLRVAKVYYNKDVQDIQTEHEDVQGYGEGAAEEWRKGLNNKGKEAMADAARWEKWESQTRPGTDMVRILREYDLSSFPRYVEEMQSRSAGVSSTTQAPAVAANGPHALPQPVHVFPNGYGFAYSTANAPFPSAPKATRNPQEVEEARAARKADIERRCLQLETPLTPNVLQHMESYQAALQIPTPMDDRQWETLLPRLLLQREVAELVEHQRTQQLAALQAAIPAGSTDEMFLKPAKEVYDRDYEQAQEPLRKRLGEYADEIINGPWRGGQGLDRDTAPSFAIQTLLHVRKRYGEEQQAGNLPVYDDHARSEASKQGTPPLEPFLSLDNMKWVFDNKVRVLTDQHRRDLFICSGCVEERKPKWFAFEGLIQHYGAKHTVAFSKGNIVVHWQTAEWPEEPPFHTNPAPWTKVDRKASDYKAHGRARHTPQHSATHDGPFVPPSPSILLSDNPLFASQLPSNGHFQNAPGYLACQSSYGPQQDDVTHHPAMPAAPAVDMSYDAQLEKLATDARQIWDQLYGVGDMLECVRVQVVIKISAARFTDRFHEKPSLDLMTDALATNAAMRPIKTAAGLACRACVGAQTDGSASYQSYYARIGKMKLYNLSSLITHFKISHEPGAECVNWVHDMIELPERQLIGDLLQVPGMDDEKLGIIAQAFPGVFPTPLPRIGVVTEAARSDYTLANALMDRLKRKPTKQGRRKGQHGNDTPARDHSQEPLPEPGPNEYDPTRPMYSPTADPAGFDSDIARRLAPSAAAAVTSLGLTPETLAALNSMSESILIAPPPPPAPERSPSVGRSDPLPQDKPAATNEGGGVPDISAILASLTGQWQQGAQTATPPATIDNRTGSAPRQPPTDPYGAPPTHASPGIIYHRPETLRERAPVHYIADQQQQVTYRASAEPSPPDILIQRAVARNTRQYEHDQQHMAAYASSAAAAPSRSPPRYRAVYAPPEYHREQPVHYIQVQAPPEHGQPARVQYAPAPRYEHPPPPPKQMYYDQYGRRVELIPIVDSAPAPVQYAPHPFEQQQQQEGGGVYRSAAGGGGGQQVMRYVAYDDGARSSEAPPR